MMKNNTLLTSLGILFSAAVLLPASVSPNLFVFKTFGISEITQLLTFLFLVSLFLERALEVFITTWRRPGEEEVDNEIIHCRRRIAEIKEQIRKKGNQLQTVATTTASEDAHGDEERTSVVQTPRDTSALMGELDKELTRLKALDLERGRYKSITRKMALWMALVVGVLLSGVGIRSLETFVNLRDLAGQPPIFYGGQLFIFRSLDTLLTGGLIAGGSEGIHKLTQVFTTFLEETRNQIRDKSAARPDEK